MSDFSLYFVHNFSVYIKYHQTPFETLCPYKFRYPSVFFLLLRVSIPSQPPPFLIPVEESPQVDPRFLPVSTLSVTILRVPLKTTRYGNLDPI